MAKKTKANKEKVDVCQEALERFKLADDAEEGNRERALEATRFLDLEQWDDNTRRSREGDPDGARPCLTVDKLNQYVNQIKNEQRINKPEGKIRPVDDKGDVRTAEIITGIIRNIKDQSSADIAIGTAYGHAVDGGYGYWRITSDYIDDTSFSQELQVKRVRNRFSVRLDPYCQDPAGADANWGFIFERIPREEFKRDYPDANPCNFEDLDGLETDWADPTSLIVAEYYRFETTKKTIYLDKKGNPSEEPIEGGKSRVVKERQLKWSKLTCAEELDSRDLPGKYIPIVRVVGNETDIEGELKTSGAIRGAIDSQKMYNYSASAFVEMVALAPRAPWVAAEGQIEGYEQDYKDANRRNIAVLTYKPVLESGALVPQPTRQPMPGFPVGWQQAMQNFEGDMQGSIGIYNAGLGAPSNETSGKAINSRKMESDVGTYHFADNLAYSIRHGDRILIDLIPSYYDTKQTVRILGEDDKEDFIRLDPDIKESVKTMETSNGKVNYYNVGLGKYDVRVTVGPSYTTKRQEGADWMERMVSARPDLMNILGDLMFKAMDVPYADKASERLQRMLPPELQEEVDESILPPDVKDAIGNATRQIEQREQVLGQKEQALAEVGQAAQGEIQEANNIKKEIAAERKVLAADKKVLEAARRVFEVEAQAANSQLDAKSISTESGQAEVINLAVERAARTSQEMMENALDQVGALVLAMEEKKKAPVSMKIESSSGETYEGEIVDGNVRVITPSGEIFVGQKTEGQVNG